MAPPLRGVMGDLLEEVDASNGTDLSKDGDKPLSAEHLSPFGVA